MAVNGVTSYNLNSKIVNKFMTQPIELKLGNPTKSIQSQTQSTNDSNASRAFMSYFQANQNVKAEPSFTGHFCETRDFKVKQLQDVPCACCGKEMMTNSQAKEFTAKVSTSTGEELSNYLNASMKYLRPAEKAVAEHLAKEALKYPEGNVQTLLQGSSVSAETLLKDEQKDVMTELQDKAQALYGENKSIENLINKAVNLIDNGYKKKKYFQRKPFLANLASLTQKLGDEEKAGQMMDVAVNLPTSSKSINAFLVKYSRRNSFDIARRLTTPAVMTAEHVHPKSKGGPNHTANYMGECQTCNGGRGTTDLKEWMQEYPNMPRSSQRYIDEVTGRIIKGDIGGDYDDYPVDIRETLAKETKNVIVLKVKNPEEITKIRQEKGIAAPEKTIAA